MWRQGSLLLCVFRLLYYNKYIIPSLSLTVAFLYRRGHNTPPRTHYHCYFPTTTSHNVTSIILLMFLLPILCNLIFFPRMFIMCVKMLSKLFVVSLRLFGINLHAFFPNRVGGIFSRTSPQSIFFPPTKYFREMLQTR